MTKILFLCTGNTCRSPMAKALLEKHLLDQGNSAEIQVVSMGMSAQDGLPASPEAITVMNEYGIDLNQHRSKRLQDRQVQEANLILTMTGYHCETLRRRFPNRANVIFPFRAFVEGVDCDVVDPFGGGLEIYRASAAELHLLTRKLIEFFNK